ncbi:MAG TPA: hypothetical protein ENI61_04845 [Ignavibacteria bacterium]|nr:hypothetical protein [Ignavibacteria bacterium]
MIKHKSPLLAGILNFLFFGVGYIYLGKRKTFGWIMLFAGVVMTIEYFIGNLSHLSNLANTHTISFTIVAVAVAVDGYLLGKEK